MKVSEIVEKLGLKVFSGNDSLENEVTGGYVSDLLSDVMGNANAGELWVTLQTHKNIMAVASLKDLSAIILVNSQVPDEDTLQKSNEENIPILGTKLKTFETVGTLFHILNK